MCMAVCSSALRACLLVSGDEHPARASHESCDIPQRAAHTGLLQLVRLRQEKLLSWDTVLVRRVQLPRHDSCLLESVRTFSLRAQQQMLQTSGKLWCFVKHGRRRFHDTKFALFPKMKSSALTRRSQRTKNGAGWQRLTRPLPKKPKWETGAMREG